LRAERLSPRDPRGWLIATPLGVGYYAQKRFAEAATCFEKALALNPRFMIARRDLAASYALMGEREKAAATTREVLRSAPELSIAKLCARTTFHARNGAGFTAGLRLAGMPE